MRRLLVFLVSLLTLACGGGEPASEATSPASDPAALAEPLIVEQTSEVEGAEAEEPPEIERPYEEGADAQAEIDAAVVAAAEDGKRVLLVFGANWCHWCRRLDWVLQNEPQVSGALEADYHLVHVDVGPRESSTNRAIATRYGDPISNGLPCLVVLDPGGGVVQVQETGSLEEGEHHDPDLILAFLRRWRV